MVLGTSLIIKIALGVLLLGGGAFAAYQLTEAKYLEGKRAQLAEDRAAVLNVEVDNLKKQLVDIAAIQAADRQRAQEASLEIEGLRRAANEIVVSATDCTANPDVARQLRDLATRPGTNRSPNGSNPLNPR